MKATQTILKILDVDYYTYDDIRHHHFVNWCYGISQHYYIPLKVLLKNDALLNFFHDEWHAMVEQRICQDKSEYIRLGVMTAKDMFEWISLEAEEIKHTYPLPILKMLKKEIQKHPKIYETKSK